MPTLQLGAPAFLDRPEARLGRTLRPGKRGVPLAGGSFGYIEAAETSGKEAKEAKQAKELRN